MFPFDLGCPVNLRPEPQKGAVKRKFATTSNSEFSSTSLAPPSPFFSQGSHKKDILPPPPPPPPSPSTVTTKKTAFQKKSKKNEFCFNIPGDAFEQKVALVLKDPPTTHDMWMERLNITQEGADIISRLEQGTQAWLDSRKGRITGSNFGAAIGVNKYIDNKRR